MVTIDGALTVQPEAAMPISHRYLAVYSIETDDLPAVLEEVRRRAGTSQMILSSTLGQAQTICFEAVAAACPASGEHVV
jgi:hypothetical protein